MEKPKIRQTSASAAIRPGGCTFGSVECGTQAPSRYRSSEAGMYWPISSQKNGSLRYGRWIATTSAANARKKMTVDVRCEDTGSRYWITEPAACGSSLISPNADSYCCTFWFSTFASALACCGLKKTP